MIHILNYLFLALFSLTNVSPAPVDSPMAQLFKRQAEGYAISIPVILFGLIMMILGLIFLFFGLRLFRVASFIAGVYLGGSIAYIILSNVEPTSGYQTREYLYLFVSLAVGIVFGLIAMCIWRLGLLAIGAFGGFTLSLFLLSWSSDGIFSGIGRIIFIIILVIVGAVLALIFEKLALILATSFAGAFSVIYGIDMFANAGFNVAVKSFLGNSNPEYYSQYNISRDVYIELVALVILFLLGVLVQFRINRNRVHREGYNKKF
ncbi:hypothetical protein HDU92_001919 [Lobulomyces angularis]|nr:hypothetical protein HDU92_001919 [Lobulomyces angularis]